MSAGNLKKSGTSGKMLKDTTTGKLKRCNCCAGQCVCCDSSTTFDCCVNPSNPPCGGGGGQPACQFAHDCDWTIDGSLSCTNNYGCAGTSDTFAYSGTATSSGGCIGGFGPQASIQQSATSTLPSYALTFQVVPSPTSGNLCDGDRCAGVTLYESCAGTTRVSADAGLTVGNNSASGGPGCANRDRCNFIGMSACVDHDDNVDVAVDTWTISGGSDTPGCYDDNDFNYIDSELVATATFVRQGCIVKSVELTMVGTVTITSPLYPGSPQCAPLVVTIDVTGTATFPDITGADCASSYDGEVTPPDE